MKYLITGLGNIGPEYWGTRHNIGFRVVNHLVESLEGRFTEERYGAIARVRVKNRELVVLKPNTFMNLSGKAVSALLGWYKAALSDLLVIYDDIDIPKGTFRFRERGSAGTHNGMRDIIASLGSGDFARLRIGTGKVPENIPLVSYVLMNITDGDRALIGGAAGEAADKAIEWLNKTNRPRG